MGRTARAGRSGKAITFVSQYDIELYQRIEHLIGKKLPLYETVDDEVMAFRDDDEIMIRFQPLLQEIILLRDKIPNGVGFVNCLQSDSPALPWQQCSRQQGRYTCGNLSKHVNKTYSTRHFIS